MITFRAVSKRYPDGTTAVDDLTLDMRSGEITVLLGPSGCGKTTTLRMINRLIEPTSGLIELDGRDLGTTPVHELRRGIGYVIQQTGLFPHLTIAENIATVPRLLGWDKRRRRARALELIELVGLDTDSADRYPSQLSGGQQQRVGVARALAADPPVLLMDEPFGAVDPVRRRSLQTEFRRLQHELAKTVVFVTHDVDEAVLLGDRVAVMREGGKLLQFAPPDVLLAQPSDPYVAAFLGATRGLELLSLRAAAEVPVQSVNGQGIGGWQLRTDPARRPLEWVALDANTPPILVEPVGPGGSLRDLLESAVTSPARAAVRVDADGVLLGTVPFAAIEHHLPTPRGRTVEEAR
jgi:osmoprotectant transport system ATP-binding protein